MSDQHFAAAAGHQAGFSLVETLVAFTILSLVTIAALQSLSDNTKQLSRLAERDRQFEQLASAIAGFMAGIDENKSSGTIQFEPVNLENYRLPWTSRMPKRVKAIILEDGKPVVQFETIMILDAPQ